MVAEAGAGSYSGSGHCYTRDIRFSWLLYEQDNHFDEVLR